LDAECGENGYAWVIDGRQTRTDLNLYSLGSLVCDEPA
jgi:hypothetical protein